jgi:hypothetical protein
MTQPNKSPQPTAIETPESTVPSHGKHSFNWGWIVWPGVIFVLYFLSWGPIMRLSGQKPLSQYNPVLLGIYRPWVLAYFHTPLRKPLGIYMHWWAPAWFTEDGNWRMIQESLKKSVSP